MENIEKDNSLETAKNRLSISGVTHLDDTKYAYDRVVKNIDESYKSIIPIVKNSKGEDILRYKNLMYQYYWLIHDFIPTCTYQKLCRRGNEDKWINFDDYSSLRGECIVKFLDYNHKVIDAITVLKGQKLENIPTPTFIGHIFNGWYTSDKGGELYDFSNPINSDVVVYAQYDIMQYSVVFKYYDSTVSEEELVKIVKVDYNSDVAESDVPDVFGKREGYTFTGWDGSWHNVTENRIITAQYSINEYTVQFFNVVNPDSEIIVYELILSEKVKYNRPASIPSNPIYTNYIFDKWVDEDGNDVDLLHIKNDIDIYPHYVANSYIVKFVNWDNTPLKVIIGGEEVEEQTVKYKESAVLPTTIPDRPNYTFSGWSQDTTSITRDCTIVAQYTAINLVVTFMGPDGTVYKTVNVSYNTPVTKPINPQIEQYDPYTYGVFDYWYFDATEQTEWDFNKAILADTTLYGKYKGTSKNPFVVTFYNYDDTLITGDTVVNPKYTTYGSTVDDTDVSEAYKQKEQYEFIGWDKPIDVITSDINITATFNDVQTYVVRFIDGVSGEVISATTVNDGESIYVKDYPQPTTEYGYTFNRWDGNTINVYENKDITAIYDLTKFTITFVDYHDNVVYTINKQYLETCVTPSIVLDGAEDRLDSEHPEILSVLVFNGKFYYVNDEGTVVDGQEPEDTIVLGDTKFKAQYDVTEQIETHVSITYKSWDSSYVYTDEMLYGYILTGQRLEEIKTEIENAIGERGSSYTFYGFQDENGNSYKIKDDETGEYTSYSITSDMTLTMRYDVKSLKVTFKDNINKGIIEEKLVVYNNKTTAPIDMPEIQYYTFSGKWFTDEECTNQFDFNSTIINDITLYGKYTGNVYTISFNSNGGSVVSSETVVYPNKTTKPTDPTKEGYNFDKWYSDEELTTEFIFGNTLTEHITLYAGWNAQVLTVTFDADGGTPIPTTQTVNYGDKLTSVETVTKDGYNFDGWYNGSTLFDVVNDIVTSNMTLTAKWTKQSQTFEVNYTSNSNLRTQFNANPIEDATIVTMSYDATTKSGKVVYTTTKDTINIPSDYLMNQYDLLTIELPDIIDSIESNAFNGCTALTTIDLGSTRSIGTGVFSGCSKLTAINSMDNLISIGTGAFELCVGLTTITIPDSMTSIGNGAFRNCTSLTTVKLGGGVTTLGYITFQGCTSLTSISLSGIVTIGNRCFDGCSSLNTVYLRSTVTIEMYAFQSCTSLNKIYTGTPTASSSINANAFSGLPSSGTLYFATMSSIWTSWKVSPFYDSSSDTWIWEKKQND